MSEMPDDAFEIVEQSPDRLAFKRTINMAFFKNVIYRVYKIAIAVVILACTGAVCVSIFILPFFLLYYIPVVVVWISVYAFYREKTALFMSIVLDRASSRCQVSFWMIDSKERTSTRVLFKRPLGAASDLEIVAGNDLRGLAYAGIKEFYKNKYVLKPRILTWQFPIYPGFIYTDTDPGRVFALKTLIDNFLSSPGSNASRVQESK